MPPYDNPIKRLVQSERRVVDGDSAPSEEDAEEIDSENIEEPKFEDDLEINSGDCICHAYASHAIEPNILNDQNHTHEHSTSSHQRYDNISIHLPPRSYVLI